MRKPRQPEGEPRPESHRKQGGAGNRPRTHPGHRRGGGVTHNAGVARATKEPDSRLWLTLGQRPTRASDRMDTERPPPRRCPGHLTERLPMPKKKHADPFTWKRFAGRIVWRLLRQIGEVVLLVFFTTFWIVGC